MNAEPSNLPSWVNLALIFVVAVAVMLPILAVLLGILSQVEVMPRTST